MPSVSHPDRIAAPVTEGEATARRVAVQRLSRAVDLLDLQAARPERYPVLLESSGGAAAVGRFDILMGFPEDRLTLNDRWQLAGPAGGVAERGDFLDTFDDWWRAAARPATPPPGMPFHGGWFIFLAYEVASQIEPSIRLESMRDRPIAAAIRIPAAIIRDRATGLCHAVAEFGRENLIGEMTEDASRVSRHPGLRDSPAKLIVPGSVIEDDPSLFLHAAEIIQRHIAEGNIYQANICRRWRGRVSRGTRPWMLYERLRRANPAPFSGLALLDRLAILCSSPERLLRVCDGQIETRPIAGTRPRTAGEAQEGETRAELLANPKERAEHVMLIDLERSDLGRVCRPGSVRVKEFMTVESYAHVHHIVSSVTGLLRPDTTPGNILRAVFPGGTITGCPKVRCMSIIRELEGQPRGAYTGTMGYLNHDGSCDFNILIRTITMHDDEVAIAAGCGIVADSDLERELDETRAKAKGLLLTLNEATRVQ